MKKILIFLVFVAFALSASAQTYDQGKSQSTSGALNGTTAMNIVLPHTFNGKNLLVIQALCTQVVGTSEGTIRLQGSIDGTTYIPMTSNDNYLYASPNDTLTVTNGATGSWYIKDSPFKKYRLTGVGGSGDTTTVTVRYVFK